MPPTGNMEAPAPPGMELWGSYIFTVVKYEELLWLLCELEDDHYRGHLGALGPSNDTPNKSWVLTPVGMLGGKNPFLVGHLSAKFEHVADTLERYFFFKSHLED